MWLQSTTIWVTLSLSLNRTCFMAEDMAISALISKHGNAERSFPLLLGLFLPLLEPELDREPLRAEVERFRLRERPRFCFSAAGAAGALEWEYSQLFPFLQVPWA